MPHLPALITSGDVMPGGRSEWSPLGRSSVAPGLGSFCWQVLALAHADLRLCMVCSRCLKVWFQGQLKPMGLVHPHPYRDCGGLFIPDPSIGRWAQWRQTTWVLMRFP